MGVKRYFMNEKEADAIRKSMYESLLMDETIRLCIGISTRCAVSCASMSILPADVMNRRMESARRNSNIATVRGRLRCLAKSDYLANDDIIATVMGLGWMSRNFGLRCLYLRLCRNLV